MSGYPPQQPGPYPPQGGGYPPPGPPGYSPPPTGQPGYPGVPPPPYPGGAVPPYQQYQAPLPGQMGYQWGAGAPTYPFASFWARVGAAVIDGLVCSRHRRHPGHRRHRPDRQQRRYEHGTTIDRSDERRDARRRNPPHHHRRDPRHALRAADDGAQGHTQRPDARVRQVVGIRITNLQGGPISTGQAWGRYLFRQFVINGIAGALRADLPSAQLPLDALGQQQAMLARQDRQHARAPRAIGVRLSIGGRRDLRQSCHRWRIRDALHRDLARPCIPSVVVR